MFLCLCVIIVLLLCDYIVIVVRKHQHRKKFVEIIDQNASIKDENEKLEALVHQLSAETDTIIEYVALYRHCVLLTYPTSRPKIALLV